MNELIIQQSTLESIANAVRAKKGTIDLIPVTSLATEIESIETGGGNKLPLVVGPQSADNLYDITAENLEGTTEICDYAFYNRRGLGSIIIPDSVTSIGSEAFKRCQGLTSIIIPDGVTKIGVRAFWDCDNLASIIIPDSVTSIGSDAFFNTLWYNNLPNGLVYAGKVVYEYKGTMPDNTSIVLKDGTIGIANSAFYFCKGLTSITIPDSVTSVGDYAFQSCSGLTNITIGNGVESIGNYAFNDCRSLTSITIPDSVTDIGMFAFYNCSGLTSITIGNSVTSIGNGTFYGCTSLTSITIPDSVTSVGDSAFEGCSGLTSITIPYSVTSIGYGAFKSCSSLMSITIPFVGENKDGSGSTNFGYILGSYYGNDDVPSGLKEVIITGETNINSDAFYGCSSLTNITILGSVAGIGSSAFYGCTSLTSIIIPNSVAEIDYDAFGGCTSLTSITIPNSVTRLGERALQIGSSTNKATIIMKPTAPPSIQPNTLNSNYLNQIIVPKDTLEAYKTATNWSSFADYIVEATE